MTQTLAEHALCRVCDYLSARGIELSREVTIQAMQLVQAGLASEHDDPLKTIMENVREKFGPLNAELPPVAPGVIRGSMGYEKP
jgi:hypothetical protein